ncbi:TPA: D-glycero-beta-D-manno-heptose-7-phosphate kinase [Candidatus Woesearchaeota archaeon]|nr:D-glycero-beta-D-manno-heptose-7-phosphate kinase [Candidatus Woesearchaeota archaeon]
MGHLQKILDRFRGKRIMVIGDSMLDKYVWGEVSRISPEAPVQVVDVQRESYAPGGATNVAMNAAALGARVRMMGITGDDEARKVLLRLLEEDGISVEGMLIEKDKPTTLKMRVMARSQQLLRVDYEKRAHSHPEIEKRLIAAVAESVDGTDAIIISDYAKGVVTKKLMETLLGMARKEGKIVIIDPKPQHKGLYKGATLITPNHAEACQMADAELDNGDGVEEMGRKLAKELDAHILLTRGEKGMSLCRKDGGVVTIPARAKEVYDVTGAGDTVVAAAAIALAAGASFEDAASIANHAAGIKVGKIGTSTVTVEELRQSLSS